MKNISTDELVFVFHGYLTLQHSQSEAITGIHIRIVQRSEEN